MHTFLSTTLLFTTLGAAASIPAKRADSAPTVWTSPDGGNTNVRFGDGKVYVGSCSPKDVLNTVYENCYTQGFCNAASWSMQCVQGDDATHTITITAPEGQYQPWIRNGLVDAMQSAIATEKVTTTEQIKAMSGGGCVGCTWTSKDITVYHMPSTIGISHLNDGTVPDVITLSIVNEDSKADGGMCEILTGIGGAVAGSVNGAAGGIFSLASLVCSAI